MEAWGCVKRERERERERGLRDVGGDREIHGCVRENKVGWRGKRERDKGERKGGGNGWGGGNCCSFREPLVEEDDTRPLDPPH